MTRRGRRVKANHHHFKLYRMEKVFLKAQMLCACGFEVFFFFFLMKCIRKEKICLIKKYNNAMALSGKLSFPRFSPLFFLLSMIMLKGIILEYEISYRLFIIYRTSIRFRAFKFLI